MGGISGLFQPSPASPHSPILAGTGVFCEEIPRTIVPKVLMNLLGLRGQLKGVFLSFFFGFGDKLQASFSLVFKNILHFPNFGYQNTWVSFWVFLEPLDMLKVYT